MRPIAHARFVLATDLDGTFLGGEEGARRALYDWIEANRETVGLIFVTGRDPAFIADLCAGGVPWPEYAVGDVGTTIAEVSPDRGVVPIAPLEEDIARRWGDSGARVRQALQGAPGLTLQPTEFRYRVSYDMNPAEFDAGAAQVVSDLGLDSLISDNRFFDVLPRGVSKGPSILRLVDHLGIARDRVLTAGDTMNDHSMLICGLRAVAVGNAEVALLDALGDDEKIHRAVAPGAAGILEAVAAHGLHPVPET